MAWSTAWAERALSSTRSPVYVLRVLSDGPQPAWSSHALAGAEAELDALGCSIQWGSTGPHRWAQPVSSARFALLPSASIEGVYQGSVVQLSIVLGDEEQPVWVGVLQNATRSLTGPLVLQCVGMEGALWSRMIELGAAGYKRRFFDETDPTNTYTVAIDYTAGDATIDLAGSPTLRRRSGSGGVYCIKVTPNSGADFYLTGSAWSDPTLTIDTAGALDTVDANADAGNTVRVVAYDAAHPCNLASRALADASSWPDEWNMRLPGDVWDATDAASQASGSGLSTAEQETFTWAAEQPMERIGDVLGPLLSDAGVVLCQYQGRITARIIPSPNGIAAGVPTFTRADVVQNGATWTAWAVTPQALAFEVYDRTKRDPLPLTTTEDITTAYGSLVYAHALLGLEAPPPPLAAGSDVTSATPGSSPPNLAGNPVQDTVEKRLPIYGNTGNRLAARQDVHQRLKWYSTHRPERLTVTLRGWHPHPIGTAVAVDLAELPCRGSGPGGITTGHPAVIVGGGPDYFGATTTYELLCVPTNTDT